MSATPRFTDEQVDQVIGRVLQIGVMISSAVVLIGAFMLLTQRGGAVVDFSRFTGSPAALHAVSTTFATALRGDPLAVVQAGLILLIATPIARVLLTFVAFIALRDRLYVVLTAIVLGLLLAGLFFGLAAH